MYLHKFTDHYLISNEVSQILIPFEHLLVSIKASLKTGLPVIILYHDHEYDLAKLKSKHFIHNDKLSFINTSLKNRFETHCKISNLSEMLHYMLELNTRLS